jgi:hypothetical protein
MSMRNGVRAIGLSLGAWMLCLGTLSAQEVTPADAPPFWLFEEVGAAQTCAQAGGSCEKHCNVCDAHCVSCVAKCDHCSNATHHAGGDAIGVSPEGYIVELAQLLSDRPSWAISDLDLVWYGEGATCTTKSCGACDSGFCATCASEFGLIDCLSPLCGIASDLGDAAKFCEGMQCSEEVRLEPGEPAEVLLEIRNRVGISPLTGTAYQPIDSTTCAKAQNTFVSEVRESAEMCVATDDDAELNALFNPPASECTAATSSVAAHSVSVQNGSVPKADAPSADMIPLLRLVSRNLEDAANALEEAEMYFRADQLRELANELRLEARTAGGSWSLEPLGGIQRRTAPSPQPDVARENEDLRAELERLQESLRASHETPGKKAR